jgi:cytochrome c oxidase accessory protein FixG
VQVCPTGIDIRHGLQYQCIACAACVDVCDSVMDRMGYPRGLIRYTTQNELEVGRPRRILRPRVLVYSTLLGAIAIALVVAVLLRVPLELDAIRDRNQLYRETADGRVENVYTLKILNMDTRPHSYRLRATGVEGLAVAFDRAEISAAGGEVIELPVRVQAAPARLAARSTPIRFVLEAEDDPRLRKEEPARFVGPGGR